MKTIKNSPVSRYHIDDFECPICKKNTLHCYLGVRSDSSSTSVDSITTADSISASQIYACTECGNVRLHPCALERIQNDIKKYGSK